MRVAVLALIAASGCGRIAFDALADGGADAPGDGTRGDPAPPSLACGETRALPGAAISGRVLEAAVTSHGLAIVWLDASGAVLGSTWDAAGGTLTLGRDAVPLDPGPYTDLWLAGNADQVMYAAQGAGGVRQRVLDASLAGAPATSAPEALTALGRNPLTQLRDRPGFALIGVATASGQARVLVTGESTPRPVAGLLGHALLSIAADGAGYAVVSELQDQYGPGCWLSHLDAGFALEAGPGSLESTQQADCDSSIAFASPGTSRAALAWMDRDPVSSYAAFRDTNPASGSATSTSETGVGLPRVTATSAGLAMLYRSPAGVRVFDGRPARTLAPPSALADLLTWADQAFAVWSAGPGAPQLTRLCP